MLIFILRNLKTGSIDSFEPMNYDWEEQKVGVLRQFSQYALTDSSIFDFHGLSDTGYIFYPNECATGLKSCKLHVHLHGCTDTVNNNYDRLESIKKKGLI